MTTGEATDRGGLILTTDKLPIPDTAEEVLQLLRHILSKQFVQDIHLQSSGILTVQWYRAPSETIHDKDPDVSPDTVLDRMALSDASYVGTPKEKLIDCVLELELNGLEPTNIFCHSLELFKAWLGYTKMFRLPMFDGKPMFTGLCVVEVPQLTEDTLVVCASPVGDPALNYITTGIRLLMEKTDGR